MVRHGGNVRLRSLKNDRSFLRAACQLILGVGMAGIGATLSGRLKIRVVFQQGFGQGEEDMRNLSHCVVGLGVVLAVGCGKQSIGPIDAASANQAGAALANSAQGGTGSYQAPDQGVPFGPACVSTGAETRCQTGWARTARALSRATAPGVFSTAV